MCGERFRRRYVEREYIAPVLRMIRGSVVHTVAQTGLTRKMTGRDLLTIEEAHDLAADDFLARVNSGVTISDEDRELGWSKAQGVAKDFAIDLSGYHAHRVVPVIQPVGVERRITVKPKDSDLEIEGTIDLIDRRPEGEAIRDLKTSEKSPAADTAARSQQLTMYAMIRMAEVGRLPHALMVDTLVRTPAKAEKKHIIQDTTRGHEDVRALVARLNTAVEAVKKGIFVPARPEDWWCSAKFCDYFETCPYTAHGKSRPQS